MLSAAMATQQHRARPPLSQPGAPGFHSCIFGLTVVFLTGTLAPLSPYPTLGCAVGEHPSSPARTRCMVGPSSWQAARAGKIKPPPPILFHW